MVIGYQLSVIGYKKEGRKEMKEWMEGVEPLVYSGRIKVPYTWSVGECGSRFLIEIRDNKKIFGVRCPECKVVFVPPKQTCGRCFSKLDEWVELGSGGTLDSYTVVRYSHSAQPIQTPFGYGIIKLDGADTGFVHLLSEFDPDSLKVGMRVEAVFKEKREGNILDIKYFRPME